VPPEKSDDRNQAFDNGLSSLGLQVELSPRKNGHSSQQDHYAQAGLSEP
jgi:hypothetical protein